jgi:hypothetical protein
MGLVIMLSEISQTEKDLRYVLSYMQNTSASHGLKGGGWKERVMRGVDMMEELHVHVWQ